jgi:hypothetical protein
MPSDTRGRAHRRILNALEELRAAYHDLFQQPPATGTAHAAIARAVAVLADVPSPYAIRTAPMVLRAAALTDRLPPAQLRLGILQISTELLGVTRDLTRNVTFEPEGTGGLESP